jgi:hypothetical protein
VVVCAIGNPGIAVRCDPDAHQSEEIFLEREISLRAERASLQ